MKAAVLFAPKTPLEICDVQLDDPGPKEVLVRVAASGLCHSDYHFICGDLPMPCPCTLGHEVAGVVEAVGSDVTALSPGDHVVGNVTAHCGHCANCVSGKMYMCTNRPDRAADETPRMAINGEKVTQMSRLGGFAEMVLTHENSLVKLPREMPLDRAALLGCSVVTGLGAVFNAAQVKPGSTVAVVGCGGVGLNVIQAARMSGADRIIAVDLMPEKLAMAEKMGATHVVKGGEDAVVQVREANGGGVDHAFEVIGLPVTMNQAITMLKPGGLMTIVGASAATATTPISGIAMLTNEWRIQGSYMGSSTFVREAPRYADLFLKGKLDLDSLVSEQIRLDDINSGFETMLGGKQARSVITFDDVLKDAARG